MCCCAHYVVAQFLEQFNRSLDCIWSHWARFTVLKFIFMYVYFVLIMWYCNMVRWTWWD